MELGAFWCLTRLPVGGHMRLIKPAVMTAALSGLLIGYYSGISTAAASPESSALIDDGIVELQRSDWQQALGKFLAASIADPKDA